MDAEKLKKSTTVSGNVPAPGYEDATGAPGPIKENGQHTDYWVLSEEERAKGFIRPVRKIYIHSSCGTATVIGTLIAETYARDPKYYGSTFCCDCGEHYPVGEFKWGDEDVTVGD